MTEESLGSIWEEGDKGAGGGSLAVKDGAASEGIGCPVWHNLLLGFLLVFWSLINITFDKN